MCLVSKDQKFNTIRSILITLRNMRYLFHNVYWVNYIDSITFPEKTDFIFKHKLQKSLNKNSHVRQGCFHSQDLFEIFVRIFKSSKGVIRLVPFDGPVRHPFRRFERLRMHIAIRALDMFN